MGFLHLHGDLMRVALLLWVGLLFGGVAMSQPSPWPTPTGPASTPMSREQFWKLYPMPTATPNPSQRANQEAPLPSPTPSPVVKMMPTSMPTISEFQRNPQIGPFAVPSPGETTVPDYRGKQ